MIDKRQQHQQKQQQQKKMPAMETFSLNLQGYNSVKKAVYNSVKKASTASVIQLIL